MWIIDKQGVIPAIAAYSAAYEAGFNGEPKPIAILKRTYDYDARETGFTAGSNDRALNFPRGTSFHPPTDSDFAAYEQAEYEALRSMGARF